MKRCGHCERPLDWPGARVFCTTRCRKRAARRRAQGLPENALNYPANGRRTLEESYAFQVAAEMRAALVAVAA